MTIKVKLVLKALVPLVAGLLILSFVQIFLFKGYETDRINELRAMSEEAIQAKLKGHIDMAFSLLEKMKQDGADQEACLRTLEELRFGDSGSLWVHSYDPIKPDKPKMVMHPAKPAMNGKDLSHFSDLETCRSIYYEGELYRIGAPEISQLQETRVYSAMNQQCKKAGEGFVRYYTPKSGSDHGVAEIGYLKLSCVKLAPDWGWVLGVEECADTIDQAVALEKARIEELNATILYYLIGGFIGLSLVVGVLNWFFGRSLSRAIHSTKEFSEAIAMGDLSRRLHLNRRDEIGQLCEALDLMAMDLEKRSELAGAIASGDLTQKSELSSDYDVLGMSLQSLAQGLNDIIGQINQSAGRFTNRARQVSDSSQALSQGATEQAASLQEITSSMNVLGSQTKTNAENASQANSHALTVRDSASKGANHMQGMVSAMEEINDSSQQISRIIKVIDDIAFQTNLLALNAAVEAARAGRHGKGFAVVAEEVRNLAARSAKAAHETGELIEGSAKKVQQGSEIAHRTAEALSEIVEGVTRVTDLVGEIASASNEQAMGIGQVNEGLAQIDSVTHQNTATAEETASAAMDLSAQALQLKQLLTRFKLSEVEQQAPKAKAAKPAPESHAAQQALSQNPQPAPAQQPAQQQAVQQSTHRPAQQQAVQQSTQSPAQQQAVQQSTQSPAQQQAEKEPIQLMWGQQPTTKQPPQDLALEEESSRDDDAPQEDQGVWGGQSDIKEVDPVEVIALDDDEFGRY